MNQQISEEEKRAIIDYLSGELTDTETKVLNKWLAKRKENKKVIDELSDLWNVAGFSEERKKFNTEYAWQEISTQIGLVEKKRKVVSFNVIIRYAAVFVIALFFGGLGYYLMENNKKKPTETLSTTYVSPLGSRSFVQLNDGSKIWLNAGTTLNCPNSYGINNRELHLTGEAFFDVAKNSRMPFIVRTGEINIVALGTQFNVKAYAEETTIETTLIEGSVKLEGSGVKLAEDLVLKPNEKAVYTRKNKLLEKITEKQETVEANKESPKLKIIESVEVEPVISWKNNRWVIQNEKLGDLAVKLERRFNVNFIFDTDVLKEYSFGGTLKDENLEQIMEAISLNSPVKYLIDNKTVYVYSDSNKMKKFNELIMK